MIRTLSRGYRTMATATAAVSISIILAPAAHASGSSMPWEQPLQQVLQSIEGPVANPSITIDYPSLTRGLSTPEEKQKIIGDTLKQQWNWLSR